MSEKINDEIREIDRELAALGEPEVKWSLIVKTAINGTLAAVGTFVTIYGLHFAQHYDRDFYIMFVVGILMLAYGVISVIVTGIQLRSVVIRNRQIEELQKKRDALLIKDISTGKENKNEDLLLKLLSEGKITVEEYKQLSKKQK